MTESFCSVRLHFAAFKREVWIWTGVGLLLWSIGKALDPIVFPWITTLHTPWLDRFIVFTTEQLIWGVFILFALVTAYRVWRSPHHKSKLVPAGFAVFTAAVASFLLKAFFDVPRPFNALEGLHGLIPEASASFPSAHTAVTFALLVPFYRISKPVGILWGLFSLFIGLCRVYENVHYPSDIAGGIALGGIIGSFFSHKEVKHAIMILWNRSIEFRRQSMHFILGFLCVFAHWKGILRLREIAVLLIIGLVLSFISVKKQPPLLSHILSLFDRPRDTNFPGRGAFYFLLGVFLSILIFPVKIAYAAILVLSVGDSLNHLFGRGSRKGIRLPWNRAKNPFGVLLGIGAGVLAAQFFVPFWPAVLAASIAILFETIPFHIGRYYLNDNLYVPLIAGGILMIFV